MSIYLWNRLGAIPGCLGNYYFQGQDGKEFFDCLMRDYCKNYTITYEGKRWDEPELKGYEIPREEFEAMIDNIKELPDEEWADYLDCMTDPHTIVAPRNEFHLLEEFKDKQWVIKGLEEYLNHEFYIPTFRQFNDEPLIRKKLNTIYLRWS